MTQYNSDTVKKEKAMKVQEALEVLESTIGELKEADPEVRHLFGLEDLRQSMAILLAESVI
jgi:hypothetical protein